MRFRSQASVEFVSIVAISLLALLAVWYYVNETNDDVKEEIRIAQAKQVVSRLKEAADLVYTQGPPAQFMVDVQVPDLVADTYVRGKMIALNITTKATAGGKPQLIYATTIGNVTGDLSKFEGLSGLHVVNVSAQADTNCAVNNCYPYVSLTE